VLNDKKKVKALSEEYHDIDISFQDIIKASPNILVVEDDLSDSFIIEKIINGVWADCDIYKAQTLRSAYDIYKNNIIDLILLDLDLPDSFISKPSERKSAFRI